MTFSAETVGTFDIRYESVEGVFLRDFSFPEHTRSLCYCIARALSVVLLLNRPGVAPPVTVQFDSRNANFKDGIKSIERGEHAHRAPVGIS